MVAPTKNDGKKTTEDVPYVQGEQFPTLTAKQAATKMWNSKLRSNGKFLQTQIMEGNLGENAVTGSAPSVKAIATRGARTGFTALGTGGNPSKTFKSNPQLPTFIPHPDYYPDYDTSVMSRYDRGADNNLTRRIAMGAFMGGNSVGSLKDVDHTEIARNLHMQAQILDAIRMRPEFNGYMLDVDEGVYKYEKLEERQEGDMADFLSKGRAVGYKMYDYNGEESIYKLWEVAQYLQDFPFTEKVMMEYNTWNEGGAQTRLFVGVPDMRGDIHGAKFKRQTETIFNGTPISGSLMLCDVIKVDEGPS